jgi:hypothetical protein
MNWFRSNVGGMLLIVWNSLIYYVNECCNKFLRWRMQVPICSNGMKERKVSLFHVFHGSGPMYWHYRCKQLARISGNRGFQVTSMLFTLQCMMHRPIHCWCTSWCQCIHIRRCVCLLLNCALADGCTRQYSVPVFHTGWSDCTFWQQLHPKSPPSALSLPRPGLCLTVVDIKFAVKQISQV